MKILQVLSGGGWAGTSVVVMAITRALIARGDEVWVLCLDDEVARRFRAAGAVVVRSPFWFRPVNPIDVIPFCQLLTLCSTERFDLVDTHTSKGGFLGRVAARLAGVPHIVHHTHGFYFCEVKKPAVRRFYLALEQLAARAGHWIISVSEEHHRLAIENHVIAAERICTIQNGIDMQPFIEAAGGPARRSMGFQDTDLLVGSAGRLATQKGFEYLIQAWTSVCTSFPAARAVIAGEGPLDGELRQQAAQAGIGDRVHFLGFRADVAEVLAALDVYVQPSLWEGLPISLLEAMAAGKPIVATDIRGNRELIDHGRTGLLVPPADPDALARALQRLLADRAFAEELGQNARREVQARFSEERMVEQTLTLYDNLTSVEPGPADWAYPAAKFVPRKGTQAVGHRPADGSD